jgi:hypothetical protein
VAVVPTPTKPTDDGVPVSQSHSVSVSATDASYFCTDGSATPSACQGCSNKVTGSSISVTLNAGASLYVRACDANDQPSLNVWSDPMNYDTGAFSPLSGLTCLSRIALLMLLSTERLRVTGLSVFICNVCARDEH